jgi:hypothetical protein
MGRSFNQTCGTNLKKLSFQIGLGPLSPGAVIHAIPKRVVPCPIGLNPDVTVRMNCLGMPDPGDSGPLHSDSIILG